MGAHFEGALDLFDDEPARDPRERLRPERRSAEALIEHLKRDHCARIVGEVVAPERPARFAGFPDALDPRLRTALEARGIRELYSHQREAWAHVTGGHDTVIVTPTASGKTLCYNLPVIDAALKTGAKALYLFPTKALSQDQVERDPGAQRCGPARGSRLHLRRRHARRRTARGADARRHRRLQPRHASPGDPAASHQVGAVLRGAAVRGDRRAAHLPWRLRLARLEPRPAAAPNLPVLQGATRSSSPARRRSRTRRSWRSGCSAARCARSPSPARRRAGSTSWSGTRRC